MLLIECPYCGERDETEFAYYGQAHINRPLETEKLSDDEWADYLFMRNNTKGAFREQWLHAAGCRRYFNAVRDTVSYKITTTYKIGEKPPLEGEA